MNKIKFDIGSYVKFAKTQFQIHLKSGQSHQKSDQTGLKSYYDCIQISLKIHQNLIGFWSDPEWIYCDVTQTDQIRVKSYRFLHLYTYTYGWH